MILIFDPKLLIFLYFRYCTISLLYLNTEAILHNYRDIFKQFHNNSNSTSSLKSKKLFKKIKNLRDTKALESMSNFYANLVNDSDGKLARRNYKHSLPIAINESDESADTIKNLKRSNKVSLKHRVYMKCLLNSKP